MLDKELKELSTLLPASYEQGEYGRATSIMALAVRQGCCFLLLVHLLMVIRHMTVNAEGEPLFNSHMIISERAKHAKS